MKEARAFVKDCALNSEFWERRAESKGYHLGNVDTIQLVVEGECLQDWFPKWANAILRRLE